MRRVLHICQYLGYREINYGTTGWYRLVLISEIKYRSNSHEPPSESRCIVYIENDMSFFFFFFYWGGGGGLEDLDISIVLLIESLIFTLTRSINLDI